MQLHELLTEAEYQATPRDPMTTLFFLKAKLFSISNSHKNPQQRRIMRATGGSGITSSISRDADGSKQI